jgi:hypothetical protein
VCPDSLYIHFTEALAHYTASQVYSQIICIPQLHANNGLHLPLLPALAIANKTRNNNTNFTLLPHRSKLLHLGSLCILNRVLWRYNRGKKQRENQTITVPAQTQPHVVRQSYALFASRKESQRHIAHRSRTHSNIHSNPTASNCIVCLTPRYQ